jgi:hypothetical protein
MLYLKNTLGGLSRSLTDSALSSFQGPHRWWKLALLTVLFVLPGGSVGVALFAWVEHRRGRKGAQAAPEESVGSAIAATSAVAATSAATRSSSACQGRLGAPCRAAAGKLARQTTSADSRV